MLAASTAFKQHFKRSRQYSIAWHGLREKMRARDLAALRLLSLQHQPSREEQQ
jgi:hypothetical protein